jgi:phosphoenolpyruvate synthase/pyruvate phosphate dikinase
MLKDLRRDIKDAPMPQWMLDELQSMHESFPKNTAIRVRSSSNNEDLPGFSGAGLYTSKTQHLDEGHISKSVKQVYASLWNFRAYDERDYYRVNHYIASMGLLCHPNYQEERANGVGVSTDPIYQTDDTFYLNTQVGEDLITNPENMTVPEEILLDRYSTTEDGYTVIRSSNQVEDGELVMDEIYLGQIREFLSTIHDEFAILYDAVDNDTFAMDIEYKITSEGQLIIKQARPWATFWSDQTPQGGTGGIAGTEVIYFPNPASDFLTLQCDCNVITVTIANTLGQIVSEQATDFTDFRSQIEINKLVAGLYIVNGIDANGEIQFSKKFLKK